MPALDDNKYTHFFHFPFNKDSFFGAHFFFTAQVSAISFWSLLSVIIFRLLCFVTFFFILYNSIFSCFVLSPRNRHGLNGCFFNGSIVDSNDSFEFARLTGCYVFTFFLSPFSTINKIKMPQHVSDFCQSHFSLPRATLTFRFITTPHIFSRTIFLCHFVFYYFAVCCCFSCDFYLCALCDLVSLGCERGNAV